MDKQLITQQFNALDVQVIRITRRRGRINVTIAWKDYMKVRNSGLMDDYNLILN